MGTTFAKITILFLVFENILNMECNNKSSQCCQCCSCCRKPVQTKKKLTFEQEQMMSKDIEDINKFIENCEELGWSNYTDITNEFTCEPKVGLENIGATCYMNATLQLFVHIKELIEHFKYDKHNNVRNALLRNKENEILCLSCAFKRLIENIWQTKKNPFIEHEKLGKNSSNMYYSPSNFKKVISAINPLFEGVKPNDAKDLINTIIMTLHEELNTAKNKKIDSTQNQINQTDENEIFKHFKEDFKNTNRSKISDIFYGINKTETMCSNCGIKKYNFQTYFFLIYPLEEVRKYICAEKAKIYATNNVQNYNQMYNYFLTETTSVSIDDCFKYNEKIECFTGENAMYCNNCKVQYPATYKTKLYTTPKYLFIILNRGKGIEFKVKCNFKEEIDLINYVSEEYKKLGTNMTTYELVGIVTHMGDSGANGHFVASCKSPIDNNWYRYNDDIVYKINNFNNEIADYAMPYVLLYKKKHDK